MAPPKGAAQQFLEQFFGGLVAVRETDFTLTTTVQEVLRNDPERLGYIILVTGATTGQFAFRSVITTATAILVAGVGGSFSVNVREDFTLVTNALHGNVAAGTTTIHIVEIVRVSAPVEVVV